MFAEPAARFGEPLWQRDEIGVREHRPQGGCLAERLAQCREVAWATAAEAEPGQRPFDVGAMTEALAQCGAPFWVEDIEFDRIEPRGNRRGLSQGCREVLGEQPRPGRGDGPIDR